MTKLKLVEIIRAAIQEWAQRYSVEVSLLEVNPSGIELDVQIIVVARKGFENWPEIDRFQNLYKYLLGTYYGWRRQYDDFDYNDRRRIRSI